MQPTTYDRIVLDDDLDVDGRAPNVLRDAAQVVVEGFSPGDEDVGGADLLVVAFDADDPIEVVMGVFRMASSEDRTACRSQ